MHRDFPEVNTKGEVLIVEDTPASLKLLSDLLGGAGYAVRQAPNGELALWTAQSRPPDLILLDVRMPGLDGFEVCRRLKASPELREVPVIFLSAQHDTDDKVRGFALGAVDFIAKPFQAEEILARTDAHVRLRRAQLQLAQERITLERRVTERTAELEQVASTLAREVQIRRANEELLRLSGQVFEATQDAILITDPQGIIVTSNPAFTRITGYTAQDVRGMDIMRLHAGGADEAACAALRQGLRGSGCWSGEVQTRRKSGDTYPSHLSATTVYGPDGAVINYIGVFLDISERKAEQHLIDFLSWHDALTGLPNRALVRERFEQQRLGAIRDGQQMVLMCLDLDRFKNINDSHGQAVGDKALQVVARFLTGCVREGDTVARQGGDEFQILLQDDALLGRTMALAQTILAGLREELSVGGDRLALTTSIGIAMCPADGDTFDDLLRHADTALVRAKEMGRDHYAFFTERMGNDIRARLAMQRQMRGAIARNEFEVHYQPQLCLRSGAMLGAEALLRWDNPVLGKVPPNLFIALAEEYGLITAIGEWVLDTVCAQIRDWQAAGLGSIKVAVNLSGKQFAQDRTVPFVEATLRKYGLDPSCLGIEITESTVMGDPDKAVAALTSLKDIGVSISLDDFGTGYSSLGYLKRFPIDVLKIDKSFVDDVTTSSSDAAIALSVISLAHNLHMRVIAEGVETREQVDFLTRHGCDEMQGYYFSRPLAVDAFTALLREQGPFCVI
ncbi:GGDEF/EAL domain-containing response regulator [Janthinobacterium psychrotolerans]|uniref:PAS domain S-box-containing protein/diguanylate cyclase (GGDEF) domain-containing protein n=1 Tax=Janthinobacterium psychrotolerans TaxID=1747903 RepID=A0A1A7C271_9BURK|nr:GGDEF domain-containing response regulator [Janthinobacterium psychrotolerans]OBV38408.1 PAS domain S-box-containing protein/diguanylate cyclase (GGDEF) domain-containing protein [Janthinobacterium psychrotolerans]